VIWGYEHTELTSLSAPVGDTNITYHGSPAGYTFTPLPGETLLAWDESGHEFMTVDANVSPAADVTRGAHGSLERDIAAHARLLRVHAAFSTHDIDGFTFPITARCGMPSGYTQDISIQEGQSRFGAVQIPIQDTDGFVTKKLESVVPVNTVVVILGGYAGMDIEHYTMVYSGKVGKLTNRAGVYTMEVGFDLERLNHTLYAEIEDFAGDGTDTLGGDIIAGATTLTLTSGSGMWEFGIDDKDTGDGKYVSFYLSLKTAGVVEYVRVSDWVSSTKTVTIERGAFGTTDANHAAATTEVRYFISYQDNPLTILLYLLLSRGTATGGLGHADYDLSFGSADPPLGAGFPSADIDITAIETLRDRWFADDVWVLNIRKRTKLLDLIKKNVLKPLNCALHITRAGKLGVAYMKPPVIIDEPIMILDESNIIGSPQLVFDRGHIINNVTVNWEYDVEADESDNTTHVINATSQSDYDRDGTMTLEARGVSSLHSGSALATKYATKKNSYYGDPLAPISLSVLLNEGAKIEPGQAVRINHTKMPDTTNGTIGFDRYGVVVGKRIDWVAGTVELEVLDTFYKSGGRVGVLGPSNMLHWLNATDDEQARYIWLGGASDNLFTDGTKGYVLY
jgi:hypothetical protein